MSGSSTHFSSTEVFLPAPHLSLLSFSFVLLCTWLHALLKSPAEASSLLMLAGSILCYLRDTLGCQCGGKAEIAQERVYLSMQC